MRTCDDAPSVGQVRNTCYQIGVSSHRLAGFCRGRRFHLSSGWRRHSGRWAPRRFFIVCESSQLGSLEWNELFGGQRFPVSRRTYLLSPRFLSIYAHEALLIREFALKESILTHWTFLTMYGVVVAALLEDFQVTF